MAGARVGNNVHCIYARAHRREQVADGEAVCQRSLRVSQVSTRLCLAQDPS